MNKLFKQPIVQILIVSFVIRMVISFLPAFEIDQNDWRLWGIRLSEVGAANFYSDNTFTSYTPGFLYFLWFAGIVKTHLLTPLAYNSIFYDLILKLPANIADILTGLVIYKLVKSKFSEKKGQIASLLYIFNPAIFFNSSIWGQFDGVSTLLLLLSLVLLLRKKLPEFSSFLLAISLTIKPQAIFFVPAFAILFFLTVNLKRWLSSFLVFVLTMIVIYLPFTGLNLSKMVQVNTNVGDVFQCTTCFALNFWGLFGNWQNDTLLFLNVSYIFWGIALSIFASASLLFMKPFRLKYKEPYIYLIMSTSIISYYTFLTRMHERYIFPSFVFLLLAAFLIKSRKLLYFYFLFSFLSLINLYIPYAYYNFVYTNKQHIFNPPLIDLLMNNFNLLSAVFFICFLSLIVYSGKLLLDHSSS